MKKFIYILSSLFICVLLTACANQKGGACKGKHPNVSVNQLGTKGPNGCTYGGYRWVD
jgi:hypothetical protein